jgi:hypothetical protein
MTRDEWLQLADKWQEKAELAEHDGDLVWGEVCEKKADACRFNAQFSCELVECEYGCDNDHIPVPH